MGDNSENSPVPTGHLADEVAAPPEPLSAPLDRFADPLSCGEPVPFDPELYQTPLTFDELVEDETPAVPTEPDNDAALPATASTAAPAPSPAIPAAPAPPPGPSPLELLRDAVGRQDQAAVERHLLTLGVDKKVCDRILAAWQKIVDANTPRQQRVARMLDLSEAIRQVKGAAKGQDELWRLQKALTQYT